MNEKTDTATTDEHVSDTDRPVSTEKESAEAADQAVNTPAGDTPDAPAEPEFVMPSKWAIRRMVLALIWRKIRIPLLILVAVVAVVLAVIFGWQLKQKNDTDDAAAAGLAAARAYAVTLTSVDSGNLDRDFTAVLDGSTGEFKDMYTRSSGQLRQLLLDNKATGKGTVLDAAVKSATPTKVEVLLFIDQTVSNSASADPRVDRSRVMMTMERVDDRWLASRVSIP
ncbi:hypothetical protein [Nocardia gamkensis]|uniref:Mce associated membrane protein n=1 Tax=Nocardia gamkensis TaxID=352869 RepID=A0A7X6L1C2_9NOCA|nr:hypothetical protein [Nocardia gamkensis]NKY25834.1 hypothetical protein [Nocardia gamkensis]NQE68980.1 uncharacterized protein [Nocardia gamkensis]